MFLGSRSPRNDEVASVKIERLPGLLIKDEKLAELISVALTRKDWEAFEVRWTLASLGRLFCLYAEDVASDKRLGIGVAFISSTVPFKKVTFSRGLLSILEKSQMLNCFCCVSCAVRSR